MKRLVLASVIGVEPRDLASEFLVSPRRAVVFPKSAIVGFKSRWGRRLSCWYQTIKLSSLAAVGTFFRLAGFSSSDLGAVP